MKVVVLGLGTMGWRIAKNFAKEGVLVGVWNRTEEKAKRFSSEFGVPPLSLSELEDVEYVLLSLSDDEAVSSVMRKFEVRGKVVVDTSTISPRTSISLAEEVKKRGGVMYDAPITGSTGIEQRKATVMVGGPEERKNDVISLLRMTADKVIYVGGTVWDYTLSWSTT
ncbi:NAD(P)-dependent oxidoreductase [Sulfuracidifex tepidarius]|uniref:NAD(P)-dependent oxidoreductase n=1 Tax=Sulfuracidifex tepidarius TaxID=1294262 RepID=UPI0006D07BE9|nr:NAD(P)-binding domain-containing protein [Sulfuracidifex tepidarius]